MTDGGVGFSENGLFRLPSSRFCILVVTDVKNDSLLVGDSNRNRVRIQIIKGRQHKLRGNNAYATIGKILVVKLVRTCGSGQRDGLKDVCLTASIRTDEQVEPAKRQTGIHNCFVILYVYIGYHNLTILSCQNRFKSTCKSHTSPTCSSLSSGIRTAIPFGPQMSGGVA